MREPVWSGGSEVSMEAGVFYNVPTGFTNRIQSALVQTDKVSSVITTTDTETLRGSCGAGASF